MTKQAWSWRALFELPKTPGNVVLIALILFGFVNFFSFIVVSIYLGGDAMNGRTEAGRYFLSEHGRLHEVPKTVFTYSLWHARSLFLSHPLVILAGWLAVRRLRLA